MLSAPSLLLPPAYPFGPGGSAVQLLFNFRQILPASPCPRGRARAGSEHRCARGGPVRRRGAAARAAGRRRRRGVGRATPAGAPADHAAEGGRGASATAGRTGPAASPASQRKLGRGAAGTAGTAGTAGGAWLSPERLGSAATARTGSPGSSRRPRTGAVHLEQRLFRRLAVFVGGWRLEAAEAVCAAPEGAEPLGTDVLDGLSTLLDQSLVWQREETDGAARLRMLHVIREYALEHLEQSGEAEALWRAHVTYYLTLAEEVEPWLVGGPRLPEGLARLEREHDNLRAALAWARRQREVALGLRLAGALARFWVLRGHLSEGREWLEGLLALEAADQATRGAGRTTSTDEAVPVPGRVPGRVWAKALFGAGELATYQQDFSRAVPLLEQSLTLAREAGEMALTARLSTRAARPCFKATSGGPPRGMRRASPWRGSWAIRPSSAFQ